MKILAGIEGLKNGVQGLWDRSVTGRPIVVCDAERESRIHDPVSRFKAHATFLVTTSDVIGECIEKSCVIRRTLAGQAIKELKGDDSGLGSVEECMEPINRGLHDA